MSTCDWCRSALEDALRRVAELETEVRELRRQVETVRPEHTKRAVLEAMSPDEAKAKEIAQRAHVSLTTAYRYLGQLAITGRVWSPEPGIWALVKEDHQGLSE